MPRNAEMIWYVDGVTGNGHWMPRKFEKMPLNNINYEEKPFSEEARRKISESNKNSKLTIKQRKEIKADTRKARVIAAEYGVTDGTIHNVRGRKGPLTKKQKHAIKTDTRRAKEIAVDYAISAAYVYMLKREED